MLQVKSAQDRWEERVGAPQIPAPSTHFPDDALAVIYPPARSAMTSGKARAPQCKLRFQPRSLRYVEPLMGWTANDDTLSQVELAFPSMEAAVTYARRQGLHFVVRGLSGVGANVQQMAGAKARGTSHEAVRPWRLEWVERTLGPEVIQQGVPRGTDASSGYANPKDVLADPALTQSEKRDVLQRWALDAYLIELALSKGLPVSHQSRLDDVIDALIDLDDTKPAVVTRDVPQPARTDRNAA
jgi:ETC complex I subunit conserved region